MRISDWSSDVCSSDLPVEGTVASPDPEQFRHTWELQPLKFVRMADGRLDPTPLATLDIYVGRSAPFLWMPASDDGSQEGRLYFQWFDRGSTQLKAFQPSPSSAARWPDMTATRQYAYRPFGEARFTT